MNGSKFLWVALAAMLALPVSLMAAEGGGLRWFQFNNRLRLEYDDNVYLTDDDEQDSGKIIEEMELFFDLNLDQTFASLRYRPSFIYWTDRDDDTDFNHDIDFVFRHEFSPRLSLSAKNTFRFGQEPQLVDRGTTVEDDGDFIYNTANAKATYKLAPKMMVDLGGAYTLLRYDDDDVADTDDYNIYAVGANLRRQVLPETAAQGELRYETIDYDHIDDRGSDTIQVGAGVEQTFSPSLLGNARAGWEHKSYEDSGIDDSDAPYVDGFLTYLPSPATRLTAGLGYALSETDVYPFTNQERFRVFGSLARDLTARLAWYLTATYVLNDLDKDDALSSAPTPVDGSEDIVQLSTRLAYRLNRANVLEAGWQFSNLDSDVREDYTRNRVSVGWKTELF